MKAGECQIMSYPRPSDLAVMKTDPKLKMLTAPGFNIGYLSYNLTSRSSRSARCARRWTWRSTARPS